MSFSGGLKHFILLQQTIGNQKTTLPHLSQKIDVLAGELLTGDDQMNDDTYLLYNLNPENPIELQCEANNVKLLSQDEFHLLLPIAACSERLKVFRNWLDEGKSLKIGDTVTLYLMKHEVNGKLRFKGRTEDQPGTLFGVELNSPIGHNDISNSNRYFNTEHPNTAIIVPLNKIRKYNLPLQIGDRVVWIRDEGNEKATVRWIGNLDNNPEITVGVEFDNPCGTGTGLYNKERLFKTKPGHASLLPMNGLLKESVLMEQTEAPKPYIGVYDEKLIGTASKYGRTRQQNSSGSYDVTIPTATVIPFSDKKIDHTLEIGSMVEIPYSNQLMYGVIRWIGDDENLGKIVGLEMDEEAAYCSNGYFQNIKRFNCPPRKGFFIGLHKCKRDRRFDEKEKIRESMRTFHYVRADKVMKLRSLLDKVGNMPGMMDEEKDPEELLNCLFGHVMKADPLLQLRFGKDYKMYKKIVPSLQLDVTNVLEKGPRECVICGKLATKECKECYKVHGEDLYTIAFCDTCDELHTHSQQIPIIPREKMELFAVICIETSHYVSFVKNSNEGKEPKWVFYDSMADREGCNEGYNIPEVRYCPNLQKWITTSDLDYVDPDQPELQRRLFSDSYMCLYQNTQAMMFQ
uniref:ubiquitinyl hydrolase 1 n=1 Tax=Octopus bimaculoides TaxID=37653 RepID=A0A0L8GFT8_OCTBM